MRSPAARGIPRTLVEVGRAAWPDLRVDPRAFAGYVSERLDPKEPLEAAHQTRRLSDLYLACACIGRDPAALAHLERLLAKLHAPLGRIDPSPAFADEVIQLLREKLLVGRDGGEGKLGEYAGKGPLSSWLKAAAVRTALNLRASRKTPGAGEPELAELRAEGDDPELTFLKSRYRAAFDAAFRAALEAMPAREKNVLRLYLLERKNVAAIGAVYQVDRTTVTRWIVRAREQLLDETRGRMIASLGLGASETESLMRLLRSRLDVSISRVLAGAS